MWIVVTLAPRISHQLIEAIVRFDDRNRPIAETYRRIGAEAERLGLTRPSYQRIRVLVHEARNMRPRLTVADVIRIATSPLRSSEDIIDRMRELGVRPLADWTYDVETRGPPK